MWLLNTNNAYPKELITKSCLELSRNLKNKNKVLIKFNNATINFHLKKHTLKSL
jgi:hypothetical protein